jgi:hypothetical protein
MIPSGRVGWPRSKARSIARKRERRGDCLSLKDKAFSTLLDRNPPFDLRPGNAIAIDRLRCSNRVRRTTFTPKHHMSQVQRLRRTFNAGARRRVSKYSYNNRLTLQGIGITFLALQFLKLIRGGHNHDVRSDIACFVCTIDVRTHRWDDIPRCKLLGCWSFLFSNCSVALVDLGSWCLSAGTYASALSRTTTVVREKRRSGPSSSVGRDRLQTGR